jgi:hypothetical protein
LAAALTLAACGGGSDSAGPDDRAGPQAAADAMTVAVRLLSSAPQWVSGGDARIEVRAAPGLHDKLEVWINGQRTAQALASHGDRLEGVVGGFVDGPNTLEIRHAKGRGVAASLQLTNHPITGPMFSGPQQHPFVCTTNQLGQMPKVDTASPPGYAVRNAQGEVVGYSRNCSIDTVVSHLYRATDNSWKPLPADGSRPADMTMTTLPDGRTVDFVVRREVGSINRFLYSFAMLAPRGEDVAKPDLSLWNGRLEYYFQGGVAIGHSQGTVHSRSLDPDVLKMGYAIVHSSGNNTGTHYNLQVAGETAMMTKERFVERYGVPLYTVGLGGSGGAIQQYILAQNNPGVLDAAVPIQSYPDMITQVTHVADCELLEHYMDVTDRNNPRWSDAKNRTLLVGMNGEQTVADLMWLPKQLLGLAGPSTSPGSTECVKGWRGAQPLVMNPKFGGVPNSGNYVPKEAIDAISWTHYSDARNIYGLDADGHGLSTWDNVGVQYGLTSMKQGKITPAEFLDLNFKVGGWKQPKDMVKEVYPLEFLTITWPMVAADPTLFDPWSRRNMTLSPSPDVPAPRTEGSIKAMRAAYTFGLVFGGHMPLPTIDNRQYLERELDMHNAHQSFAIRKRVLQKMGTSDHLVIWFTNTDPDPPPGVPRVDKNFAAIELMDKWMDNIRTNPHLGIAGNRPPEAVDSCFDVNGNLIARGPNVWDGIIDNKPKGACTLAFPLFSTSRIAAGAPFEGSIFKCALKSVDAALQDGTYERTPEPWVPDAAEVAKLRQIFPQGVCDYRKPDIGRP